MVFLLSDKEEFESEKRSAPKPTFFGYLCCLLVCRIFHIPVEIWSINLDCNCIFSGDNDIDSISQVSLAALISHCAPTFSDLYKM